MHHPSVWARPWRSLKFDSRGFNDRCWRLHHGRPCGFRGRRHPRALGRIVDFWGTSPLARLHAGGLENESSRRDSRAPSRWVFTGPGRLLLGSAVPVVPARYDEVDAVFDAGLPLEGFQNCGCTHTPLSPFTNNMRRALCVVSWRTISLAISRAIGLSCCAFQADTTSLCVTHQFRRELTWATPLQ
jgi:hypothetical protein